MSYIALGIDIGKSKFDAALLKNEEVKTKDLAMILTDLLHVKNGLKSLVLSHIFVWKQLEFFYGIAFASFMFENKYTVSVVNPAYDLGI